MPKAAPVSESGRRAAATPTNSRRVAPTAVMGISRVALAHVSVIRPELGAEIMMCGKRGLI